MYAVKSIFLLLCLVLCSFLFSACTSGVPMSEDVPALTLPPNHTSYVAPIGDAALEYSAEFTLFLPRHDSDRLSGVPTEVMLSASKPIAESIVQALLLHEGDGIVSSIGRSVSLSLYGSNPVELSRDVATVNLAASALQLDRQAFYLACQAITDTLTHLPDIHYVNVLVMDKSLGLDIGGTLPTGTFSRSVGGDVASLYQQALSQRAGIDEELSPKELTAMTTLYFPLPGQDGVLSEARSITYDSQQPAQIVEKLLQELASGPKQLSLSPSMTLLRELLDDSPQVTEIQNGGGSLVTLHFSNTFDDMLDASQLTRASCLAALCYTITTFLPNVAGIHVYIGDEEIENVSLRGNRLSQLALLFENKVQLRSKYAAFLMDYCTLYFSDPTGQKLIASQRAVTYHQRQSPRSLLIELVKGPLPIDSVKDAHPLIAVDALKDSDLLGLSINGNTLVVNFSPAFIEAGMNLNPQEERLLVYGLVNTLSVISRIQRVCFFVSGDPPSGFTGEIYWEGDFYKNLGLVQNIR